MCDNANTETAAIHAEIDAAFAILAKHCDAIVLLLSIGNDTFRLTKGSLVCCIGLADLHHRSMVVNGLWVINTPVPDKEKPTPQQDTP